MVRGDNTIHKGMFNKKNTAILIICLVFGLILFLPPASYADSPSARSTAAVKHAQAAGGEAEAAKPEPVAIDVQAINLVGGKPLQLPIYHHIALPVTATQAAIDRVPPLKMQQGEQQ